MKYFHFCGYNLLSAGAETPVFSGVMRCKPDVASPTGCRAASCRFLSFSVVFLPFRPASPAVRSSCLPRRPLLSSPPSPLPFFRAPSRSGPLYYYIIVRPSGNGAVPCSVLRRARASSLPRLFPPAPLPSRASSLSRLFPLAPLPSRALPVPLPRPVSASSQHIFLLSD